MKGLKLVITLLLAALGLGLAKSLPAMAPPGAALAFYTQGLAIKKAYLVDIQAELKRQRLTLWDLIQDFAKAEGEDPKKVERELKPFIDLVTLDLVGEEGLVAVYPDGGLLALARPSAAKRSAILSQVKKLLKKAQPQNGWMVERLAPEELKDFPLLAGWKGNTLLLASPQAFARLVRGQGGLSLPLRGDLVFFADAKPLHPLLAGLGQKLPPPLLDLLRTPLLLASASSLEKRGLASKTRFDLDPEADAEFAALFLGPGEAWDPGDLPDGLGASSYYFPLPRLGRYLSRLAATFGTEIDLDLSAFGNRLALITVGVSTNPVEAQQKPFGDLILMLEAKDSVTAEVNILSWLQLAAASATPEDKGGFAVKKVKIKGYAGKEIRWGLGQPLFLFDLGDRLALATSRAAAEAIFGPRLKEHPGYARYKNFWPKGATMKSFSDQRQALKQTFSNLSASLPTSGDPKLDAVMQDYLKRYAAFVNHLADKFGVGVSYTKPKGSTLIGAGWTEVRW